MLELSGICKSYHRQNILDGVELTVRPGECLRKKQPMSPRRIR